MKLEPEHYDIIDHAINRGAGGRYCGGGDTMDELVAIGLMEFVGKPAWCPDPYYGVTDKGMEVYREWKARQPKPPRLTKSKLRYRRYLEFGDGFRNFRDFLSWDANPERSWNQH